MEADPVHELVHDEGRPGHVPAVLHQGDEQVQDHDVRKEHQDTAHTGDDAVHDEVLEPALLHEGAHELAELRDEPVDPVHRILADGEGGPEGKPQEEKEDRESQPLVRDDGINLVRQGASGPFLLIFFIGLRQGALDEGVLGIDNGRFRRRMEQLVDPLRFLLPGRLQGVMVRKSGDELLDVTVVFQVFDG